MVIEEAGAVRVVLLLLLLLRRRGSRGGVVVAAGCVDRGVGLGCLRIHHRRRCRRGSWWRWSSSMKVGCVGEVVVGFMVFMFFFRCSV